MWRPSERPSFGRDFQAFWLGQTVSNLGSSITQFAIPLIVFELTHSAVNLAVATAAWFLPYLLFGLVIGAWVDRLDRKRLMIACNAAAAALLVSVPALSAAGLLSVWWIYAVGFFQSTIFIAFSSSEFAAIPSLVEAEELVAANGRIQASYAAASVVGPLLAGALVATIRPESLLLVDAATFVVSAAALASVTRSLNLGPRRQRTRIRSDVVEGVRYVLRHPVLRNISVMMALTNFAGTTVWAELVLFAKDRLQATNSEVAVLWAAGSFGIVLAGLAAPRLRKRFSFGALLLGDVVVYGLAIVALSFTRTVWAALGLWALAAGMAILFNVLSGSLRQSIVPNELLGRVVTVASVLAWSANPLGALVGGYLIKTTGDVAKVYAAAGAVVVLIGLAFTRTALREADRFLTVAPRPGSASAA
jgi:MFS family permease